MGRRRASCSTILAAAIVITSVGIACAQTASRESTEFSEIAARFVAQIRDRGAVRIAVLPTGGVATQLAAAFRALRRPSTSPILLTDPAAIDRALAQLALPGGGAPTSRMAVEAGQLTASNYVVVVMPQRSNSRGVQRLDLQLIAVADGRQIDDVSPEFAVALPVPSPSQPPAAPTPAPNSAAGASRAPTKPPRLWPAQKAGIISGYALAAAAGAVAWSREQDVRERRRAIEALPPGSIDDWNRMVDDAKRVSRTRDFWWAVAIGSASVTTTYLIIAGSPDIGPYAPPGKPRWRLLMTTVKPGIFLTRTY